jgi:hypothetical protein
MINVLKELNNWNSHQFLASFVPLIVKETNKLNQKSPDGYKKNDVSFIVLFNLMYDWLLIYDPHFI